MREPFRVGLLGWLTIAFVLACSICVSWLWLQQLIGLWALQGERWGS